jgi:hypothetical protein
VATPKATATVKSQPATAACPEVLVGGGVGATVGTGVGVGVGVADAPGHAGVMLPSGPRISARHSASMLALLLVVGNRNPRQVTCKAVPSA